MSYRRFLAVLIVFVTFIATSLCFAKNLNLYDQPKSDAKVIGTINAETGIVPIFTSTDKVWLKVGDPTNGNVGWVKASDLSGQTNNVMFTQQITNNGQGPQTYTIQFGMPKQFSTAEVQKLLKQWQLQQTMIEKNLQKMINDMYKNTDLQNMKFPIIMPIIMDKPADNTAPAMQPKK